MSKGILALVVLSLSFGQTAVVAEHHEEAIDIGSRLELFVDDFLVEEMSGVELRFHTPESAGKVLNCSSRFIGNNFSRAHRLHFWSLGTSFCCAGGRLETSQ